MIPSLLSDGEGAGNLHAKRRRQFKKKKNLMTEPRHLPARNTVQIQK